MRVFRDLKLLFILSNMLIFGCQELDVKSSAVVEGYVYLSPSQRTPLEGVYIAIESDLSSDVPYRGPDVICYTNRNGYFRAEVVLGNEFDVENWETRYVYYADVSILFVYGAYSQRLNGVTLRAGGVYTLPDIYMIGP